MFLGASITAIAQTDASEVVEEQAQAGTAAATAQLSGASDLLLNSPFFLLLEHYFQSLFPKMDVKKTITSVKEKVRKLGNKIKTEGINIPLIGRFKLEDYKGKEEIEKEVPKYVIRLHEKSSDKLKNITFGPLSIKKLEVFLFSSKKIPHIRCDVSIFKKIAKLIQEEFKDGIITFLMTFDKPFKFPENICTIKDFRLILSAARRYLTTKTKIFGTKLEPPSTITLDLTQPPFIFEVEADDIPIYAFSSNLKNTPLKNVILKKIDLKVGMIPPSIKLFGEADVQKINLGVEMGDGAARVSASLSKAGLSFIFDLKNIKMPLGLGTIHEAQLRVGGSGA